MCCCLHLLFPVWNIATLVLEVSSTALIVNQKDSLLSLFIESGYENNDDDDGFLFNQDFPSFGSNDDAVSDSYTETALSNPNEDILSDSSIATVISNECSPLLAPLSRIKLRTRQPSDPSCPNPDEPLQKPAADAASVSKSEQEHWCSKTVMTGFGNIPVCEEQPFNTMFSEAYANPLAAPRFPDPVGFVTLLECSLLGQYEATMGQPCPRDNVFCCNAWLPGPPHEPTGPNGGIFGGGELERDDAGWGYWCWPSDQSWMYPGPPPDWSEIMRTLNNPPEGL